jgi:wyosine [tRNA(Phe)-imidazoG37] synthetase (radical SAM superfamily)
MTIDRKVFYSPEEIVKELQQKISDVRKVGETIDYLTFVPDGEPTLDLNLGKEILLIEPAFNIDVAVITNSSLMWREDVREELMEADLVSFKIDAVNEDIWKKINRPHGRLKVSEILDGILEFSRHYRGKLITETMLIEGLNDSKNCLEDIADFIEKINAETAYVSIPTRPPAEAWVRPAREESINLGYQLFSKKIKNVEYLIGYEGNAFSFTGDVENDILSITSVHPMRKDAVEEFLNKANSNWSIIKDLMSQEKIVELQYEGKKFYMRNLRRER